MRPVLPEGSEVEEELREETIFSIVSKVFSGIFSGEIAKVDEVELESLISSLLFLLGLVGFKNRASGNSLEVAIRAISVSSEIYSERSESICRHWGRQRCHRHGFQMYFRGHRADRVKSSGQ